METIYRRHGQDKKIATTTDFEIWAKKKSTSFVDQTTKKYTTSSAKNKKNLEKEDIIQYIRHLIMAETFVYTLSQHMEHLYVKEAIARKSVDAIKRKEEDEIEKQKNKVDRELWHVKRSEPKIEKIKREKPQYPLKPKAPTKTPNISANLTKPSKPSMPVLGKPLFFNKRKVERENEILMSTYNAAVQKYQQDLQEYEQKIKSINQKNIEITQKNRDNQEQYKDQLKQYKETCEQMEAAADAAYEAAQKEAEEKANQNREEQIELLEKQCQLLTSQLKQKKLVPLDDNPSVAMVFLNQEILDIKVALSNAIKTREKLYGCGVIFVKYRNIVALTSFLDYFLSGRCSTLDGADGAYNLYEAEIRSNEIISQLKNIVTSLEEIKANQVTLYQEMKQVNRNLNSLDSSLKTVLGTLNDISNTLGNISETLSDFKDEMERSSVQTNRALKKLNDNTEETLHRTGEIAENTALTAHYSKVNAYYSKVNSDLTKAIAFMVALK